MILQDKLQIANTTPFIASKLVVIFILTVRCNFLQDSIQQIEYERRVINLKMKENNKIIQIKK